MRTLAARRLAVTAAVVLGMAMAASGALRLPAVISDHMVLQREMPVPIWGWADPNAQVTVKFAGQEKSATAGADGKWMVKLDALKACAEPAELTVAAGGQTRTVKDVLVGEVWLGSGQSNMEWTVGGCLDRDRAREQAKFPLIRHMLVDKRPAGEAREDVSGRWSVCSPETVLNFSGVMYFFGLKIHQELNVPIGLIHSSWGGTRIEPWTPPCGFALVPSLKNFCDDIQNAPANYRKQVADAIGKIEAWLPLAKQALADSKSIPPAPTLPQHPLEHAGGTTGLYNGMIHGLIPYAIRGALWYQGESNGGEGKSYFEKKQALIGGWRKLWAQGDFPFYFVQLANFMQPNANPEGGDGWARVREAQAFCLSIPNTGMAVLTDIGDAKDIHPRNKQDVGLRLALWALAKDYGKKDLVYSGPIYKGFQVDGAKLILSFDHVGSGLMAGKKDGLAPAQETPGAPLKGFSIKGEDGKWHWAEARIDGKTVVLTSPNVAKPLAARFAFTTNTDHVNFFNKEGLPGVPFRTDTEWTPDGK